MQCPWSCSVGPCEGGARGGELLAVGDALWRAAPAPWPWGGGECWAYGVPWWPRYVYVVKGWAGWYQGFLLLRSEQSGSAKGRRSWREENWLRMGIPALSIRQRWARGGREEVHWLFQQGGPHLLTALSKVRENRCVCALRSLCSRSCLGMLFAFLKKVNVYSNMYIYHYKAVRKMLYVWLHR